MQQPPGIFDVVATVLVAIIGVKLAALLGPTIIVGLGWMFGIVAAVWLRRIDYPFWAYVFVTFGAALFVSVPIATYIAPKIGIDAASLLAPVGFAVPLGGDLAIKKLRSMLPAWFAKKGARND